jgi:hypothetical protein
MEGSAPSFLMRGFRLKAMRRMIEKKRRAKRRPTIIWKRGLRLKRIWILA